MPITQSGPQRGRYLVTAADDAAHLSDFLASVANDPGIAIVDRIGPPGQPHTVVAELSHNRARALDSQFKQSRQPFVIEPDSPLSMSDEPELKGI